MSPMDETVLDMIDAMEEDSEDMFAISDIGADHFQAFPDLELD